MAKVYSKEEAFRVLAGVDKSKIFEFTMYEFIRAHIDKVEEPVPEPQFRDVWMLGIQLYGAMRIMEMLDTLVENYQGEITKEISLRELCQQTSIQTVIEIHTRMRHYTNRLEAIMPKTFKQREKDNDK